jgi:hypothetical protein
MSTTDHPYRTHTGKGKVTQLDGKVWTSVAALHLGGRFLDPTLKQFLCVSSQVVRQSFIEQAKNYIKAYAADEYNPKASTLYSPTFSTDASVVTPQMKIKKTDNSLTLDPFALYRSHRPTSTATSAGASAPLKKFNNFEELYADVVSETSKCESLNGPFEIDVCKVTGTSVAICPSAAVFNPLAWWVKMLTSFLFWPRLPNKCL